VPRRVAEVDLFPGRGVGHDDDGAVAEPDLENFAVSLRALRVEVNLPDPLELERVPDEWLGGRAGDVAERVSLEWVEGPGEELLVCGVVGVEVFGERKERKGVRGR